MKRMEAKNNRHKQITTTTKITEDENGNFPVAPELRSNINEVKAHEVN